MDIQNRNLKKIMYAKLGFTSFNLEMAVEEIDRIEKELEHMTLLEAKDYALPRKNLKEITAALRGLRKKLFEQVGMQVDSYPLEYELLSCKFTEATKGLISKVKQINFLFGQRKITDAQINAEMKKEYNKGCIKRNILDIPLLEDPDSYSTEARCVKGPMVIVGNATKEFVSDMPVLAEGIYLGTKELNELAIGTYAHELTHLLVDRHKRVVGNYLNDEILSIFKEKEAMYLYDQSEDKHLYKIWEVCRLRNVKDNIKLYREATDEYDKREHLRYIQSSLYSGILFDKYVNGTEVEKKKIKTEMARVFNGNSTIKEMLNHLGITLNKEDIDRYMKKVQGYAEEMKKYEKPRTRATGTPYSDERIAQGVADADGKALTETQEKDKKDVEGQGE